MNDYRTAHSCRRCHDTGRMRVLVSVPDGERCVLRICSCYCDCGRGSRMGEAAGEHASSRRFNPATMIPVPVDAEIGSDTVREHVLASSVSQSASDEICRLLEAGSYTHAQPIVADNWEAQFDG